MDDPGFKQKYQKYKLRVKLWEKDFKKKNGRIPSKYDIRDASQEIRDSYKMYYKLKTSFLEDTLNDVLSDDGFDILEMSQLSQNGDLNLTMNESVNFGPEMPSDISELIGTENQQENSIGFSNMHELPDGSLLEVPSTVKKKMLNNFKPNEELEINKKAWGEHVSKKPVDRGNNETTRNVKPSFNEKLFQSSSFSKRNPRKSISRSALEQSSKGVTSTLGSSLCSTKEVLPDLETILLQKAKDQQTTQNTIGNPTLADEKKNETIKTQIDVGWLERNTAQNDMPTIAIKNSGLNVEALGQITPKPIQRPTYGLANLDVSKIQQTVRESSKVGFKLYSQSEISNLVTHKVFPITEVNHEPVKKSGIKVDRTKGSDTDSIVGDSEEEIETQEFRHISKRRRVNNLTSPKPAEKIDVLNSNPEKHIGCFELATQEQIKVKDTGNADQLVIEQPSKSERKKAIAKRKGAPNRNKNTGPKQAGVSNSRTTRKKPAGGTTLEISDDKPLNPEDLKYALALECCGITSVPRMRSKELDKADDLAKEYINKFTPMAAEEPTAYRILNPSEEKRAADRKKLEAKIASGKLNENYVTINIQKKTFVRGRKTINYSKYKKKMWKDKKRVAALTGPDMDMKGCDGGTLKCFTCGQAGHFAQNCNRKGDTLLPLSAHIEEDPSPFPTLDEAEEMATQSAVAVHSRNIGKLPQAPNSAIYKTYEEAAKEVESKTESEVNDYEGKSDNDDSDGATQTDDNNERDELFMETDDEIELFDFDAIIAEPTNLKQTIRHEIPESFLKAAGLDKNDVSNRGLSKFGCVKPLYSVTSEEAVKEVTPEVIEVLKMFGHTSFRKGQDRAVMRILSGVSTLVTLSTGSGKSLCYQLPAYMYARQCKAITLVISPLVSLMEDQVTGVPHFLKAHCLHTNQTPQQRVKIMQMISDGEIDVLLVSPEAVVAGERSTGFGSILRQLPPIAFACIDEAHCVSQWSHNFRPSYLMICKVLRENLGIKCILGLTATATLPTRLSIIRHLGITDGENGIISDIPLPDNLILSVSKDENKEAALLELMLSKRFENCQSIIVYCTRRDECERVAGFLRTCLQDRKTVEPENVRKKRKRVNWHAEPYHAGMNASRRKTIQNAFMSNELRIVVATVAFGMGINKPDIRAVIHYNMPSNFERYVQEVGRAGRDNKISQCHLFLDAHGGDKNELKRHIYANSLDRHVIRKLLQRIFVPCSCDKNIKEGVVLKPNEKDLTNTHGGSPAKTSNRHHVCPGHEIGFSIEKTVEALDIPSENISTLLCYMELDNRWHMNVLSSAYIMAKVISYGGPKYLKHAAKECPPLAMAIAMEIKKGKFKETENIIEFSVIDIAAAIGWNSGVVKYQLKNLEWVQINGYPNRSPLTVCFYDLGFRIKAPGDFTIEEIDDALDTLYKRSCEQEKKQLIQLQYVFQGLSSVAYNSHVPCCSENISHDRSDQLKAIIRNYFRDDYPKDLKLEVEASNVSDADIESDVLSLLSMYPENNFSGRNAARIFHGISSPNYPAVMWFRCKFWRAHSKTDFNRIVQLANSAIVKWRR